MGTDQKLFHFWMAAVWMFGYRILLRIAGLKPAASVVRRVVAGSAIARHEEFRAFRAGLSDCWARCSIGSCREVGETVERLVNKSAIS